MKQKNIMIAAVAVFILIALSFNVFKGNSVNKTKTKTPVSQSEIIPTIDTSVVVDLQAKNNKKAIDLTIDGIPSLTTSIEYSLSYETKQQGLQGIIGTIEVNNGEKKKTLSRELGTCSSGTCVYHQVVGNIKVELKFTGAYGERIFEKEYKI
ncbi:MAG: hypothetical protein HYW86_02295 [Candidatus Roizmanbacteria bacterium]|nr:MAG: hypothetical protein HYW86_02295 [Candidatus Roizmanbacteria bacterium]